MSHDLSVGRVAALLFSLPPRNLPVKARARHRERPKDGKKTSDVDALGRHNNFLWDSGKPLPSQGTWKGRAGIWALLPWDGSPTMSANTSK